MRTGTGRKGFRLLAVLARRPLWLLAMALSAVAWVAEAASLALAPVPVVATVRNAGRGLLVVVGRRWLEEHFSRLELAGVALASAGGVLTTASAGHTAVTRRPLSNLTELAVGVTCLVGAGALAWSLSRLAGDNFAWARASGVADGAAVGFLFAGTGVFTKEIGDRIALNGARGVPSVLVCLAPTADAGYGGLVAKPSDSRPSGRPTPPPSRRQTRPSPRSGSSAPSSLSTARRSRRGASAVALLGGGGLPRPARRSCSVLARLATPAAAAAAAAAPQASPSRRARRAGPPSGVDGGPEPSKRGCRRPLSQDLRGRRACAGPTRLPYPRRARRGPCGS